MPLAPLTTLLADARAHGYALGYFEAWDGYSLEAVVEAAEAERAPVIIGTGCLLGHQPWFDGGGIELLGALGGEVARRARVPVALLLNETHTLEQSLRGLDAGFNAVMMHTGGLAYEDAVAAVAELVAAAHARGAAVEAELGNLPDAVHGTASSLTDPAQAASFVEATGVDCLAVSVGNVHLLAHGSAEIDLDRLRAVHELVARPARDPRRNGLPGRRDRAGDRRGSGEVQRRHGAQERVSPRAHRSRRGAARRAGRPRRDRLPRAGRRARGRQGGDGRGGAEPDPAVWRQWPRSLTSPGCTGRCS